MHTKNAERVTPGVYPAKDKIYNHNRVLKSENQGLEKAVTDYLQVCLSVIPANPKTKVPTIESWKPYHTVPMSKAAAVGLHWPGLLADKLLKKEDS